MAEVINEGGTPKPQDGKTVEQLQAEIDALKDKAGKSDYFKTEMENVIKQRDKLKGDIKAKEDAELIAKGDLQKALDLKIKELETSTAELEPLKQFKTTKEAEEAKEKEDAIAKLPSDDLKDIAKDLTGLKLKKFIDLHKTPNATNPDGGDGIGGGGTLTLTAEEIADAKEKFPSIEDEKTRNEYYITYVKPKLKKKD